MQGSDYNKDKKLTIGTRGSKLALVQANEVKNLLMSVHPHLRSEYIDIKVLSTRGDRVQDRNLSEIGGKGLFTEEIENALIDGRIDIAVHSLKDMPTQLPDGLELVCFLEREDVRDAFISDMATSMMDLPLGAIIGTSSLRRQAQTLALRPDLKIIGFRGNVQTRLKKLDDKLADATFLAVAGLNRLSISDDRIHPVSVDELLPAVAQGAIAIEIASHNEVMRSILKPLNHRHTELRVRAERAMLKILDGSCRTPIAGLATINGDLLTLKGRVLETDGTNDRCAEVTGPKHNPEAIGIELGQLLK
ncbi:MAG: hydroxymethylbilane synthase [Proteobacteria bacterium]|nr:hydroxymethylbilane synthase [Pseudomonadota bacterium]